tara:strand:- start:370 stop:669 length:300 start_codon:yes stop_codon:yes gene_type:complete
MTADEAIAKMRAEIDSGELTLVDVAEQLIRTISSFEKIYTITTEAVKEQHKQHGDVITNLILTILNNEVMTEFDDLRAEMNTKIDDLRAELLSHGKHND